MADPVYDFHTPMDGLSLHASAKGETLILRHRKVQHARTVTLDDKADIATVLPPTWTRTLGNCTYCIWSDETKPREGTIPFRIVHK